MALGYKTMTVVKTCSMTIYVLTSTTISSSLQAERRKYWPINWHATQNTMDRSTIDFYLFCLYEELVAVIRNCCIAWAIERRGYATPVGRPNIDRWCMKLSFDSRLWCSFAEWSKVVGEKSLYPSCSTLSNLSEWDRLSLLSTYNIFCLVCYSWFVYQIDQSGFTKLSFSNMYLWNEIM